MPLTIKQQEYLDSCTKRWNVKTGATGSGKSFVDYAFTIPKRIINSHDEGLLILMGNTRGTLERNILEPMRALWGNCIGRIRSDSTVYIFGKKVYALGADNKKHVSRIQGATFEYVYGDEITTWSEEVFQMLKSRLRCAHSHFDGTCNPDSPSHWFKQFLDSDADIYRQEYVIEDGVLPSYVVEELKKEYAGTIYYDRYILGKWTAATGVIYPMYQQAIAEAPEDPPERYILSIDYGTQNAFSAGLWGLINGVWYRLREYYYSGRETGIQKTDEEYADAIEQFTAGIGNSSVKLRTIIDPSAASFITTLRKRGKYHVLPADNAVADGIRETATAMQSGRIKITPNCKSWLKEVEAYCWDESSANDAPIKVNDHAMDETRYFVKTMRIAVPKNKYTPIGG